MPDKQTDNRSVAGEATAVYDKSSGMVQLKLEIGKDRPIEQIPLVLTLSLDGHACNIVVKTSPATADNSTNNDTRSFDRK
jgi:hypothetical protein